MNAKLKTARIGDTLYIYDEVGEKTVRKNIVPDGHAATFGNKTSEWIIDEPVVDSSKSGSGVYTWDASGNRVKHARIRYTKDANGNVSKRHERFIYKLLED